MVAQVCLWVQLTVSEAFVGDVKCERLTLRPRCTSRLALKNGKVRWMNRAAVSAHTHTHTHTNTHIHSKISHRHFTKKPNKQPAAEQTALLATLISAATMPLKGAAETQTDEADWICHKRRVTLRLKVNSERQDGGGRAQVLAHGCQRAAAKTKPAGPFG